jgi:hypothetical protein
VLEDSSLRKDMADDSSAVDEQKTAAIEELVDLAAYLSECSLAWMQEFACVDASASDAKVDVCEGSEDEDRDSTSSRTGHTDPVVNTEYFEISGTQYQAPHPASAPINSSDISESITLVSDPAIRLMKACKDKSDSDWNTLADKRPLSLVFACISAVTTFLCATMQNSSLKRLQSILVDNGIVSSCVCCLPCRNTGKSATKQSKLTPSQSNDIESRKDLTREALACLANTLFGNLKAQVNDFVFAPFVFVLNVIVLG